MDDDYMQKDEIERIGGHLLTSEAVKKAKKRRPPGQS